MVKTKGGIPLGIGSRVGRVNLKCLIDPDGDVKQSLVDQWLMVRCGKIIDQFIL